MYFINTFLCGLGNGISKGKNKYQTLYFIPQISMHTCINRVASARGVEMGGQDKNLRNIFPRTTGIAETFTYVFVYACTDSTNPSRISQLA